MRGPYFKSQFMPDEFAELYELRAAGETWARLSQLSGIPEATLRRYAKNKVVAAPTSGPEPILTVAGDAKVVEWIQAHEARGDCIGVSVVKDIASRIAGELGIDGFIAGVDWFFINAAGGFLDPLILLPGAKMSTTLQTVAVAWLEAHCMAQESATQTCDTFEKCMKCFNQRVPQGSLLILDGHSSRMSMAAIKETRFTGNSMFTLPAHSSHVTQPVDVSLTKSLKVALDKEISLLRMGSKDVKGKAVGMHNVLGCIKRAWGTAAAPNYNKTTGVMENNITSGFKKSGIYPFDPKAIDASLYAPALAFEASLAPKKEPLTTEAILAVVEANLVTMEAGELEERLKEHVKKKRASAVTGSTLLTGAQHIAIMLASSDAKEAEAEALAERKAARLVASAERAAEKEVKLAARATRKAAKAAPAPPLGAKLKKGKKKVAGLKKAAAADAGDASDVVEALRLGAGDRRKKKAPRKALVLKSK